MLEHLVNIRKCKKNLFCPPLSSGRAQSCSSITTPSRTVIMGVISSSTSTSGCKGTIEYELVRVNLL